jgi:NHLM bacteriocin system ABC transporter peptidase/ATP-binding protein
MDGSDPATRPRQRVPDAMVPEPRPGSLPRARRRRRVPTVLQMEQTECGAASLGMVLASHGLWVPLGELRVACGISRDGAKASDLLRAARGYGLAAKGYRLDLAELHRSPMPLILFWGFNHFVVLEGIDPETGTAWINDPASGPRRVPADEFDSSFTGIALAFRPEEGFERGGTKPSLLRAMLARLGRSGGGVALLALLALGLVLPGLAAPFLTKVFVDEILVPGFHDWFVPLLIGLGLTILMRGGLTALQRALTARLQAKLSVLEGSRLFWHILRAPIEFFALRRVGDLSARIGATERVARLLTEQAGVALAAVVSLLLYGTAMLLYDPLLGSVALAILLCNTVLLRVMWRRQEDDSRRLARALGRVMATSMSTIAMIETVKASGSEAEAFGRWAGVQADYLVAQQASARTAALVSTAPPVLARLGDVAILGLGGLAVMRGEMTVGELVAFQALALGLAEPVATLTNLGASVQTMSGELARIDDVLGHRKAPQLDAPGLPAPAPLHLSGRLELREVTFGYSPLAAPLLDRLSFVLEPGARIALVGASGSGKSTVGRLAAGLYRPWSGRILLDGHDVQDIAPAALAANVAYVDQSVFLFAGTVRDNLTLWDPTADDAALVRALDDAQLLEAIEARPGRLDSPLLEFGANLSGGQRQRMEIARALAADPVLVILDEATAALDPLVEERIETALRRRGCATLVIAHRLSTIRDADEIIVLERGQIVQRGRHEELAQQDGPYRHLMQADAGAQP